MRRSYNTKRSRSSYAPRSAMVQSSRAAAKKVELKMLDGYNLRLAIPSSAVQGGIATGAALYVQRWGTPGAAAIVEASANTSATLNCVSIGSTGYQREGRKINMRDITVQYVINYPSGNAQNNYVQGRVFCALVLDTQANGSFPGATDVFNTGFLATDTSNILATLPQVNMANANRYKVLKIVYHDPIVEPSLSGVGAAVAFASSQSGTLSAKLGIPCTFKSDVNTSPSAVQLSDIADNALFFMCWTGTSASVTAPVISFGSRLTYTG